MTKKVMMRLSMRRDPRSITTIGGRSFRMKVAGRERRLWREDRRRSRSRRTRTSRGKWWGWRE